MLTQRSHQGLALVVYYITSSIIARRDRKGGRPILRWDDFSLSSRNHVVNTLTHARLSKYLKATEGNTQKALELYVLNTKLSAAIMIDLHYLEIALRNKFDQQLVIVFGEDWFKNSNFLSLLNGRGRSILLKAQSEAERFWPKHLHLPRGKIIAELSFGFWLQLIASKLEHKLWVPCLHKAFNSTAPKRSVFNQKLEKLRQLRNRVAHHEPVFHMDITYSHRSVFEATHLLCPDTAFIMKQTSTVLEEVSGLSSLMSEVPFSFNR